MTNGRLPDGSVTWTDLTEALIYVRDQAEARFNGPMTDFVNAVKDAADTRVRRQAERDSVAGALDLADIDRAVIGLSWDQTVRTVTDKLIADGWSRKSGGITPGSDS